MHVTPTGLNRLFAPMLKLVLDRGLMGDVEHLRELVEAGARVASVPTP